MSERPKILYKYLPYNQGSEAVLNDCTIKFTRPKCFNDPFDCKAADISGWEQKNWAEFFKNRLENQYPDNTGFEIENCVTKLADSAINEKLSWDNISDFVDDFGVSCFSKMNNDILMWSHYADSHKGFCVGFHTDNNDYFSEVKQVNYEKNYPKLLSSAPSNKIAETIMLTKSCHWKYEKEWRKIKMLKLPNGDQLRDIQHYPENILASVIFGAKMLPESRKNLLNIITKKGIKLDLFEAKPCEHRFSLEINPFIHI